MNLEDFIREADRLLRRHGGSWGTPSCWMPDNALSFSCVSPPVIIEDPETMNDAQRLLTIKGLAKRLEPKA